MSKISVEEAHASCCGCCPLYDGVNHECGKAENESQKGTCYDLDFQYL